jgi:hypothetical protein
MRNVWIYIAIGLLIGIILGVSGNLLARKILAYDAEYNFAGEAGIDKDGNLVPARPIPLKNTLGGGILIGAITGVLLGITGYFLKETAGIMVGGVISFFASSLICSPYFFYASGIVPPVAHEKAPFVLVPGIILGVGIIILFNRLKPIEMREVEVEEAPIEEPSNKIKEKQKGKHKKR